MAMQVVDVQRTAASEVSPHQTQVGLVRRYPHLTISPAILVALLAAWWFASKMLGLPTYVVPPPEDVFRAAVNGLSRAPWEKASYWYHAGITVWEALLGFAIGSASGAFLGLTLSHWPLLGKSSYPYIVGFQSLPKVALAPLMVVWFGFASELHLLTKIIIPSCLPFLFAGLGVASVLSILGAVVGEFVGASAGLGMLLMQYNQAMEISPMFAVIILLAAIGFLMNYAVILIERRYCFWAQRSATART